MFGVFKTYSRRGGGRHSGGHCAVHATIVSNCVRLTRFVQWRCSNNGFACINGQNIAFTTYNRNISMNSRNPLGQRTLITSVWLLHAKAILFSAAKSTAYMNNKSCEEVFTFTEKVQVHQTVIILQNTNNHLIAIAV